MKNKILIALLCLGIQSAAFPTQAQAGVVGIATYGFLGVLVEAFDGDAGEFWVMTGLSAGAVVGGVALVSIGTAGGVAGGIALIVLDSHDQMNAGSMEAYFQSQYPEVDDREWISKVARTARENATLVPVEVSGLDRAKKIEIKLSEAQFYELIQETALTSDSITRLRAALL